MKHKYPIGTWVRFYQDRSIVIAVVQYLPKVESWEREPSYHTDKGTVVESQILEARSK